jgi:type IV pilus assembly protein PilB
LSVKGGRLVLAMSDPTDVLALDDLKALAGYPVQPVVAAEKSIRNLQDRLFGLEEEEIDELLDPGESFSVRPVRDDVVSVSRGDEEGAPVVRLVNSIHPIIRRALEVKASDIHIEPRAEVLIVHYKGKRGLEALNEPTPEPQRQRDLAVKARGDTGPVDVRVASLPSVRGEKFILRLLIHEMARMSLKELGLSRSSLLLPERLHPALGSIDIVVNAIAASAAIASTVIAFSAVRVQNRSARTTLILFCYKNYQQRAALQRHHRRGGSGGRAGAGADRNFSRGRPA